MNFKVISELITQWSWSQDRIFRNFALGERNMLLIAAARPIVIGRRWRHCCKYCSMTLLLSRTDWHFSCYTAKAIALCGCTEQDEAGWRCLVHREA